MGSHRKDALLSLAVLAALSTALFVSAGACSDPPAAPDGVAAPAETQSNTGQTVAATFDGFGAAEFPHDFHVDGLEMTCAECHHETNASALIMPHADYFDDFWIDCTICHRPNGDVALEPMHCGECHHAAPSGIADQTLSAKVVVHTTCWDCHDSGTGIDASDGCSFCHDGFAN